MISKSIIVFWTLLMMYVFFQMASQLPPGHQSDTALGMDLIVVLFFWGVVAVPVALVGMLFKRAPGEPSMWARRLNRR
jgi:hypothetical protein